mmetsp:Transcript_25593/g.54045  ORF Transcript_25593/g.54045 Transcript_25593/m.54045 type:complete len:1006 (+) Transcript_25593:84-3101(+)|eukprot:CAMPEP_0183735878 /NCGR_PEP_ID=MMETSP0737-20130205/47834_1 /TAXON_ID=385413 /ORGANISM="Thalassiosira miniscula, Strain CCMP1093" /LENGTH=1005 /DNA_ID=CAMNT_0025969737 /DNA_START=70 /DNA_END=3087 /DNA_ORIENTATION=-
MSSSLLGLLLLSTSLPAAAATSHSHGTFFSAASLSLLLTTTTPVHAADDSILANLDRPQAAEKINIHGWGDSSDDSSDDDEDMEGCLRRNPDGSCQIWNNVQHFANDFGELEFKWSSCDDPYDENHEDFEEVAVENSLYQKVMFEENLKLEDKCLRLDSTLQQCSSYRPHYHEPFVHLSASYLNDGYMAGVNRVVFVGGGDSMLLHEILKYEHLELVLGLELDQKVTRNSFEHFKTQPHFDNPKVQWWFGDGAKSLTLLPREYFGTFDLVLLDLSETVMSMTVTKGLDVFGAMKLLLSPKGILVKNDFGYFEKLAKVFDTCMQLLIPDVTYICDYELVLCSSDEVNFLEPTFDHLKGVREGKVETLVYKPQDDVDDHWEPVADYSKYWGEPRECLEEGTDNGTDEETVAYAGVLMVVEAENVSMNVKDAKDVAAKSEEVLTSSGYNVLSTSNGPSIKSGGPSLAITMKEGYILFESWPDAKYCKLDIHLWGNFEHQEDIRTELLKTLGSAEGDWQSYRIVTGGLRGVDTRANDLKTVGPDLAKIGVCEPVKEGSGKSITHNTSYDDHEIMGPIINAGYSDIISMMVGASGLNAVVFCNVEGAPCPAKDNLEKQGFSKLIILYQCTEEEEKEMDETPYKRGVALNKWREALKTDTTEFSLCGKKADIALKEISKKIKGINVVVADATTKSQHVFGAHEYWLKYWKSIKKPFLLLVPILYAQDEIRTFFLKSRYNHAEEEPEFYSEIYVGDGTKTMSFGLIHEGTPAQLRNLLRAQVKLDQNDAVKFTDIRKITIRGAMREQVDYDPQTFSWQDYDQRPGLEQFYGQRPVGLQSVFQLGLASDASKVLSSSSVKKAFKSAVAKWGKKGVEEASHNIGQGALFIALSTEGQVAVTWDGAESVIVNIFTYDETVDHFEIFATPLTELLPTMNLMLSDEQPRGYGKVINKSERVNHDESPDCYDYYKMCVSLAEKGACTGRDAEKEWMKANCMFSCNHCDKNNSYAKEEL